MMKDGYTVPVALSTTDDLYSLCYAARYGSEQGRIAAFNNEHTPYTVRKLIADQAKVTEQDLLLTAIDAEYDVDTTDMPDSTVQFLLSRITNSYALYEFHNSVGTIQHKQALALNPVAPSVLWDYLIRGLDTTVLRLLCENPGTTDEQLEWLLSTDVWEDAVRVLIHRKTK